MTLGFQLSLNSVGYMLKSAPCGLAIVFYPLSFFSHSRQAHQVMKSIVDNREAHGQRAKSSH